MPGICGTVRIRNAATPSAITSVTGATQRSALAPGVELSSAGASRRRPGHARHDHQHLLRALRPEPVDQDQARDDRADDRADRVRRIHATDQPAGVLPLPGDRRERERETRAPQDRPGQHRPERPHEIELEVVPDAGA